MKILLLAFLMTLSSMSAFAQIRGTVVDANTREPLTGTTVIVKGTQTGVNTDVNGVFTLDVQEGTILLITYVGYAPQEVAASNGMIVYLVSSAGELGEIVVTSGVIDIAKVRETPVAVSTISPVEIAQRVGNQEFPEVMARTPGVYATKQGGGYGDSRISLRGFDQRNTSFLINGQPVNDMENGWVYWSNWQGLTDVASGIQIQRGLGASRLAVPSVGGTVSIFTKTADLQQGGSVSQMIGNDGYLKSTISYSSGKSDRGWATSLLYSYWAGDGYVYGTAGEGHTYFAAIGYEPEGSNHSFNFSFLGAGQWHHQRSSWVSIRDYQNFGEEGIDVRWNTNAGFLNGEEFSMVRNFYNKPLATFNWDYKINENLTLATSVYGSAGRGGGTGTRGNNFRNPEIDFFPFNIDLTEHYLNRGRGTRDANGFVNFDKVFEVNRGTTNPYTGSIGNYAGLLIGSNGFTGDNVNRAVLIRRASMNSHDWYGAISNLEGQFGNIRASVGIDLRDYTGYHYRVLTDLMGLDGYYSGGNRNSAGTIIENLIDPSPFKDTGLAGPKIDYYNIGYVGWQGLNTLVEYTGTDLTAVLQAGLSNQSFQREDTFDQPGFYLSEKVNQGGGYVKGGANYNFTNEMNVFFNAGFISRQPNFDAVFPNFANRVNPNLQNEEITSLELGYGYIGSNLTINVNLYTTVWGNRFISRSFTIAGGETGTAQFTDIDVRHNGIEIESTYQPINALRFKGMVSIGDWRYTKDFTSALFDANNVQIGTGTLYTKDAKVGDAAQFTTYLEAEYRFKGFVADLSHRFVDGLYADYSITASDFLQPDNQGALKLPSYGLVDLGLTYNFVFLSRDASFRVNINNLLDTVYIAESNTNIHATTGSTTWNGVDVRNSVWFGFGRTWNAALKYNF